MFAANTFVIRSAIGEDRLAGLDSQPPLAGPVLVGEINGSPAAAISLETGRVVADPFQRTAALVALLRMRATGLRAAERNPSLRERLRAGVRIARPAGAG